MKLILLTIHRNSAHLDDAVKNISSLMDELSGEGKDYPTSVGIDGWTARPSTPNAGNSSARSTVKCPSGITLSDNTGRNCGAEESVFEYEQKGCVSEKPPESESPCL